MLDNLGDRMKGYENVWKQKLTRRMPLILRIDGKAFHSYTKGLDKPFDTKLIELMQNTAKYLCENIQGAKLAYVQSDEISILLHDYTRLESQPWFGKEIQKMVSVSAGMTSAYFSLNSGSIFIQKGMEEDLRRVEEEDAIIMNRVSLEESYNKLAVFDSRAFVLPEAEVCNYFIWRQQDATRNSIQMLARSLYSHKECDKKNTSALREMCSQKGQSWDDLPDTQKMGSCVAKVEKVSDDEFTLLKPKYSPNVVARGFGVLSEEWDIINDITIFSKERDYIESLLATYQD